MKTSTVAGGIALFAALSGGLTAHANILKNGGLEVTANQIKANKALISPDHLIHANGIVRPHVLGGWTVGGSIDIVPRTVWSDTEGKYSVDMAGSPGIGSLAQTILGLTPGATYDLSFDYAVNPTAGHPGEKSFIKELDVRIPNSSVVDTKIFAKNGDRTRKHMEYIHKDIQFVANGPRSTISFSELFPKGLPTTFNDGTPVMPRTLSSGFVLDNIDLELVTSGTVRPPDTTPIVTPTPTPEPASLSLLALTGVMLLRRRR